MENSVIYTCVENKEMMQIGAAARATSTSSSTQRIEIPNEKIFEFLILNLWRSNSTFYMVDNLFLVYFVDGIMCVRVCVCVPCVRIKYF